VKQNWPLRALGAANRIRLIQFASAAAFSPDDPSAETDRSHEHETNARRRRMQDADEGRKKLPIASGVMEESCKTLGTQRMKRSGMAWTPLGGQAILTLRSLSPSERWPTAWELLRADFGKTVIVHDQVQRFSIIWIASQYLLDRDSAFERIQTVNPYDFDYAIHVNLPLMQVVA